METESFHYQQSTWPSPSSLPFVSLISKYGLRYEGLLYHLNFYESTLSLQNVICYGTEGRSNNGFQILPSTDVYSFIVFTLSEIKDILFMPPTSFALCGLPRRSTSSKLSYSAAKPPLPWTVSSHGSKKRQRVPLLTNGKLTKPHHTTDSDAFSVKAPVDNILQIASNPLAQPQFPGFNFYDPWSSYVYQPMPYGTPYHQPPINAALPSNLHESSASDPRSFFSVPVPISFPLISGRFDFEALNKNFPQYELWGPSGNNNQREQTAYTNDETKAYTIDGSSYEISRNPFDPTESPCNPLGPIARPVGISNNLQRRHQLQQQSPSSFRGGYTYNKLS